MVILLTDRLAGLEPNGELFTIPLVPGVEAIAFDDATHQVIAATASQLLLFDEHLNLRSRRTVLGAARERGLPRPTRPRWRRDLPHTSCEVLRADPTSILHLYRRLLAARRASPALHAGEWRLLDSPRDVLAYERRWEDRRRRVAAHFGDGTAGDLGWGGDWVVEVATSAGREGMPFDGRLIGPEAVVLRAPDSDRTVTSRPLESGKKSPRCCAWAH